MTRKKFAVVIVTYNRINLLKICIEHVLQQTEPIAKIIVINNHSEDGTKEYLSQYETDHRFCILNLEQNLGGAYGFYKGLACAMNFEWDWVTLIDDDAILNYDFHERIYGQIQKGNSEILAYTGKVMTKGMIAKEHRVRNRSRYFYRVKPLDNRDYEGETTEIDYASFCGIVLARKLVNEIGLPMYQLFIRCDDFEYCMRIRKHSKMINVNQAIIDHQTAINTKEKDLSWKLYYAIRNGIIIAGIHFGKVAKYEMCLRYLLGYMKNVFIYVLIKRRISNQQLKSLYFPAIKDGIRQKLGKR